MHRDERILRDSKLFTPQKIQNESVIEHQQRVIKEIKDKKIKREEE